MFFELVAKLRTTEEVSLLCWELDELDNSVFMVDRGGWEETLKTKVRSTIAEILKNNIPQELEAKRNALRELKEEVLSLPVIRLTLAVDPTEEIITEMSEMLRNWCDPNVVLDIVRDSSIVGGVVITYNGKFADYSMAARMEKAWKDNSDRLVRMAYGEIG